MSHQVKITQQLETLCGLGLRLAKSIEADALLMLLDGPIDWAHLRKLTNQEKVLIAVERDEFTAGATEVGFHCVVLEMPGAPVYEKLTQALLEAVADDFLTPGAGVVALYSAFEIATLDSISLVHLDEHLGRLTVRDLRQLETQVPLDTLKIVVDLAVEIGREGREGKPVGTMFVVGDHRKVLTYCHPAGFDPVRGYNRKERHIADPRVREGLKEIAQMDGAFIVSSDGRVERACQIVNAPPVNVTLSKGLGTRHWAAAAISRATKAVAIAVSETNGTVRVFQSGEVVLRIEPFRRAMKWKDFEFEPPASKSNSPED
jgi:diadenylate cyclase